MLKVGVLLGGKSIEREVSFNSGRTICDHLDTQYFQVIPIFQTVEGVLYKFPWSFLYRGKIADFYDRLEQEAEKVTWDALPELVDFVYIATHGRFAEDGRLQAMLELQQIPYLGTKVFGSALAMNKKLHNDFLQANNIATPKGFSLSAQQVKNYDQAFVDKQIASCGLQFPLMVKPAHEGSSFGVFVIPSEKDLKKYITESCFITDADGQDVLVEEKIEGMEFTCIIVTDDATGELVPLPPTEIIIQNETGIFDYQQKYMPGAVNEKTPASCTVNDLERIKKVSLQVMKALEFTNLARIDGFLTKDGKIVIIDSNPLSGMGPATFLFRQAAEQGLGHAQLINMLIKAELKNYKMTKKMISSKKIIKKKVAVLFGGGSEEREISLESGRNICYKLSPEKYTVIPVFVDYSMKLHVLDNRLLVCTSTREVLDNIAQAQKIGWSDLKDLADFVFLGLHGGSGENGIVQGALEMLEIPYNGSSVFASALCMDKYKTAKYLKLKGFDTPTSVLQDKASWEKDRKGTLEKIVKTISFPCIVKPHDDGCSVMVAVAKNKSELQDSLSDFFNKKSKALIEEKLEGMELTVGVVGNDDPRALAPSETVVHKDILSIEEKFLPGAGENQTPARLSKDDIAFVQKTVVQAYKALDCAGYARIDCFFQSAKTSITGQRRVVILECNSLPGMTPATCLFHQAAEEGMRPMDLLDEIIQLGMQKHTKKTIVSVDQALLKQNEMLKK